ncbi:MAG: exodeoxyribonuclease VII large subunit [Sandaracinus sp.]
MSSASRPPDPAAEGAPAPYGVAEVVGLARELLEKSLRNLWVEGEVLDAKTSGTGTLYFTLADAPPSGRARATQSGAILRCVVFADDRPGLGMEIVSGLRIRVRGRASVFPQQSALQLQVYDAQPAGVGDRAAQVAALRAKLEKEGLFAQGRKRRLPRFPRVVGLVTSKKGAAIHDVLTVARRRFPVRIVLAHVVVQGPDAARSIAAGLDALGRLPDLDVVIVARGGGASEDLSAFDDERVVRAIAACPVPVVSGVGHEVDVTLADLAADVRAATPSNAAELVVPDREKVRAELALAMRRMSARFEGRMHHARLLLTRVGARLAQRRGDLRGRRDEVRGIERTLERSARRRLETEGRRLRALAERLSAADPRRALTRARGELDVLGPRLERAVRAQLASATTERADVEERLESAMRERIEGGRHDLALVVGRLEALSPLAVLSRGYAIALDERGRALTQASDVAVGERVEVRLERGRLVARVESKDEGPTR